MASSASPVTSPSSDKRFWSALGNRVDSLLENRNPRQSIGRSSSSPSNGLVGSEREKRFREDSLLLIRGLDSVASSLSQLTDTLDAAAQAAGDLAKPSLNNVLIRESQRIVEDEEIEPRSKRQQCGPNEFPENHEEVPVGKEEKQIPMDAAKEWEVKDDKQILTDTTRNVKLKKAKNLAVCMATKASSLARELKTVKSELGFMQERCVLLEEENRRLRDGFEKRLRPDEDDLVRRQLEALLAEKSRLANENTTLTRENQCLHQLVEYHQLTSQDLSASYEQSIQGICLDFSSPTAKADSEVDEEDVCADIEAPCATRTDNFDYSFGESRKEQKQ